MNMNEECFSDCCAMMCCLSLFTCQDARELKAGFGLPPPTEGYYENVKGALQQQASQPPPQPQGYYAPPQQGYPAPPQGYAAPPPQAPGYVAYQQAPENKSLIP